MPEYVQKRKLTIEEMEKLAALAALPAGQLNEQAADFVGKQFTKKWASQYGMSEKQVEWMNKLFEFHVGGKATVAGSPTGDSGLKYEFCEATETPGGWQILLHGAVMGPMVTKNEAQIILVWLDKAVINIEQMYGPPLEKKEETHAQNETAKPKGVSDPGEAYTPPDDMPF